MRIPNSYTDGVNAEHGGLIIDTFGCYIQCLKWSKIQRVREASHSSNKTGAEAALVVGIKQVRIDDETPRPLTELRQFGESYRDVVARIARHYAS